MDRPIFIPNQLLENWVSESKVELDGMTLRVPAQHKAYELKEAVRFMTCIEPATGDPHKLLTRVRTLEQLEQMAAEHDGESVIYKDAVYEVQQGFLGTPMGSAPGAAAPAPAVKPATPKPAAPAAKVTPTAAPPAVPAPAVKPNAEPAAQPGASASDADLLAQFLLEKL